MQAPLGMSPAFPRLAAYCASAACAVSALYFQRQLQRRHPGRQASPATAGTSLSNGSKHHQDAAGPEAAGAVLAGRVTAAQRYPLSRLNSAFTFTSMRAALHVVRSLWLSVALFAAASWAGVNEKLLSTLSQLQLADAHKAPKVEPVELSTVPQFCGSWAKVPASCEPIDSFFQLFGVPRWLRHGARLMSGLQISVEGDVLVIKQVCKISWMSVVETFPLDGSSSKPQKRRDMRQGKQTGQLLAAHDGSLKVRVCWQGALPGDATDTLYLKGTDLIVQHDARVEGRGTASFKEVYRRSSS